MKRDPGTQDTENKVSEAAVYDLPQKQNVQQATRDAFVYKYEPSRKECEAIFASSCIESAARACGVTPDVMYERMNRIHLIEDYILPCYEVLHSESRENVTEDILKTMNLWEKRLNLQ